ncbi:hypothetical protein [Pantoea cypripedii]|uniref:Uncharacterized protein n=1 Tax=Pantoea cypripedii TaxID=55209 RepID=A0A1X1EPC2_PANCY|nr:hypothetical protein [Pantoea cypripedii]MBP2195855.1 hypothetical protein [Pantoea cypripedii]ORM91832.1 hypothetical protein HA50_00070 [Pantoea cypripedii]
MDFLKIQNTDALLRDHYQLSEAAKIIGCDIKDILWFAFNKGIELCMEFHDDDLEVSCSLKSETENSLLIGQLASLPRDKKGYYILSESCSLRINDEDMKCNDDGFIKCYMKGLFSVDDEYKDILIKHEGLPDEWPSYFTPSGECTLNSKIILYVNYDERENYYLLDTLWITKKEISCFLDAVREQNQPKKNIKNYKAQSEAQKQKHAIPRVEVLMAVVALYHRDMKLRRESPAAITEHLFLHAGEFWPEKGEPPLSFDTIVSLLRSCIKKEGLTF